MIYKKLLGLKLTIGLLLSELVIVHLEGGVGSATCEPGEVRVIFTTPVRIMVYAILAQSAAIQMEKSSG
jgi:hypothetical protein